MLYRMFYLLVLAVVCSLSAAQAGEHVNQEGFSLTYPAAWKSASKKELDKISEETKKITGSDPGFLVFIFGAPSDGFAPNINVIAVKDRIPLNSLAEDKTVKEIKDGFAALDVPVPEIKTSHIHIGAHIVFSIIYEWDDPASKRTLQNWAVMFPSKNGGCIMTCTALKSQWGEAGTVFKSVINNLKFDGVLAK